ncbi:hypothetical protein JYU34_016197 [Plutella xylostella]|uniref:Uncharacterized protein n=1 Tax=Plutella xylostella TaxID=51655 RepID=A0ABQ7Q5P2_PLUXY|nr:hypothetical protein JYU34_016197 [Plutella xylostella]
METIPKPSQPAFSDYLNVTPEVLLMIRALSDITVKYMPFVHSPLFTCHSCGCHSGARGGWRGGDCEVVTARLPLPAPPAASAAPAAPAPRFLPAVTSLLAARGDDVTFECPVHNLKETTVGTRSFYRSTAISGH